MINLKRKIWDKRYYYKHFDRVSKSRINYRRTIKGWMMIVYSGMIINSKNRNMPSPNFSRNELKRWIYSNYKLKFYQLRKLWKKSGYKKDLVPSINRLDDYKPYTLDNIELTTWKINYNKSRISPKFLLSNSRPLIKKDLFNKPLTRYCSIREASRKENICSTSINNVCRNKLKTAGGFKWEYI